VANSINTKDTQFVEQKSGNEHHIIKTIIDYFLLQLFSLGCLN